MNAAAANATKTAPVPYADRPEYTSWRLMGKAEGYDHEVIFMVYKNKDRVAVIHTWFGARKLAGGGHYNAQQVAPTTKDMAREYYRECLVKGYKAD